MTGIFYCTIYDGILSNSEVDMIYQEAMNKIIVPKGTELQLLEDPSIAFWFDPGEKAVYSAVNDAKCFTKYLGTVEAEDLVEDHEGMIQNPITGEWKWL